jgi:hypothetical protein
MNSIIPETDFIVDDEGERSDSGSVSGNSGDNSNSERENSSGESENSSESEREPTIQFHEDGSFTNEAVNLETLTPEPVIPGQKYCCLTYAPHLESRTIFVIVSGCFDTFRDAEQYSALLHRRDPRFNRAIGESGRPLPIPVDQRLFLDNPILTGAISAVPFNIVSENEPQEDLEESTTETSETRETTETAEIETETTTDTAEITETEIKPTVESMISSDEECETNDYRCITCLSNNRNSLLMPCRHLPFCIGCAHIHVRSSDKCPICRAHITEILNVFI